MNKTDNHIAVITNYYPPEMGAAANRISHLVEGLSPDFNVTVIAPLPNYPTGKIFKSYKNKFLHKSFDKDITIHRLWIYASSSKIKLLRLLAMLSFGFSLALYTLKHRLPNRVIIQSPPILVAFFSILLLKSKKRRIILNVSDLWPDAGIEMGLLKKGLFYSLLKRVELYNYRNANKILGQSEEILEHIRNLAPSTELYLYRNYPLIDASAFSERNTNTGPIKIVYAGLLGIAQGILKLCQNLSFNNVEFHIYGAGPEAFELQQYLKSQPGLPIFFHGSLDRKSLHKEIINYDLALIPLVNRIYGSVPSKIFEYALLGLPLLYFGGGEGESIVINHRLGWVVEHGDYGQLNSVINSIGYDDMKQYSKKEIRQRAKRAFSFDRQMEQIKAIL